MNSITNNIRNMVLKQRRIKVIKKMGWILVSLPIKGSVPGFLSVGAGDYDKEKQWCVDNIPNIKGRRWRQGIVFSEHQFYFENTSDALLFKTTWM